MSQPVLEALDAAWRRTDELFALLDDAWFERSIPLRHPFVFYLGHLPAFAWNQIARGVLDRPSFNPYFDDFFERGIDPLDAAEAERVAIQEWPPIEEVVAYRDRVRAELRDAWDAVGALADHDELASQHRIYHLVIEHEVMHHETLFYMLCELDPSKKHLSNAPETRTGPAPAQERCEISAGVVTMGVEPDAIAFGWDNEFPKRRVAVDGFYIDRYPTTVGAFREFVEAGGYSQSGHWEPEHWAWIQSRGVVRPHLWTSDGTWRTMTGEVALDQVASWPVLVTGAEALAFASWKGARLPTEPEYHRAAYGSPNGGERAFPWGDEEPRHEHGNFDFQAYDPVPVGSHPAGQSAFGVDELLGNGWEWSSTDWARYDGFRASMRTYPGYSSDFFSGKHAVVFGAAWPTDRRLLRRSFRNWFQRLYPYVPATLRLAYD